MTKNKNEQMKKENTFKIEHLGKLVLVTLFSVLIGMSCKKKDDTYVDYQPTAGNFEGTALEYLQSQPGLYDSMLLVLKRLPRITDSLKKGDVTLFAVSNKSFTLTLNNINQARRDSIPSMPKMNWSNIDPSVLDSFMCRYILKGKNKSTDISEFADGLFFPTISYTSRTGEDTSYNMQMQFTRTNASGYLGGGPKAIIYSDPKGSIFYRYWVRVNTITVDIKSNNSIIHLLPPGHDFGFGDEFVKAVNFR